MERLIEDYYQRIQITPAMQQALAGMLHHEFDRLMSAEANELANLTANRDRLEREQTKLVQAHYADAIPLSLLKREQDRILAERDQVNRRIDAHHGDYCADIYTLCDDANRRLCNQAFFTKRYIDEDGELRVEHARPFDMLLHPDIQADAEPWGGATGNGREARTPPKDSSGESSNLVRRVPRAGLEPAT